MRDRDILKADSIFSVIDSHHGTYYKVQSAWQEEDHFTLLQMHDKPLAHGKTLVVDAKADLIYKINV